MEFLDVPLFDDDVYKLLMRFAIDVFFLTLIVAFAIYPRQSEREFAFTAVMLNVIVFFICFTMKKLELDLGLALGLFAVFGVLRYRTDSLRPKEMTYLFIVIGIGVINSLSNKKTSYAEIAIVNSLVFSTAMLKEWFVGRGMPNGNANGIASSKGGKKKSNAMASPPKFTIEYDRLELLRESERENLLNDLRERTGLEIHRVDVKSISLRENFATLTIWTTPQQ